MDWSQYFRCARVGFAVALLSTQTISADLSGIAGAPLYSAAGIVHAAAQTASALAPNAIATIYGANLSFTTHALSSADLVHGDLPLSLDGVTVYVNGIAANLFFVSPGQINFLVPYEITATTATVYVIRNSTAGPAVKVPIANTAPAFFEWNGNQAVAQHADGALISPGSPAKGGEVIVLFAAGLGRTSPDISSGYVAQRAATILYAPQLRVLLNGVECPPGSVLYAGLTPGFAGLYQINLKLPELLPQNPEIRVAIGTQSSPAAVQLSSQ